MRIDHRNMNIGEKMAHIEDSTQNTTELEVRRNAAAHAVEL